MNIKNKLKQCLINPCNKCLVYACCTHACDKFKLFVKNQSIIWISIGCIITTFLLISITYKFYFINMIFPIIIIICWLISGFLIYRAVSSSDKDNIFKDNIFLVMFSFIWLPYLVLSVYIGALLASSLAKKRTAKFITGDIWKEKIN